MEIQCITYNHTNNRDFVIDRPSGLGNWLFLLIKSPAIFRKDGKEYLADKNSFIIYTEGIPQYFKNYDNEFMTDWFYFTVTEKDRELLAELNIPLNTVTYLYDSTVLSKYIKAMADEFNSKDVYRDRVGQLFLELFYYKLSDILKSKVFQKGSVKFSTYSNMLELRNEILNSPTIKRSVDEMAAALSMSRSSFQHTYKNYFGVSVKYDIVNCRLKCVKHYLSTTNMTIAAIAECCGYSNEIHLMRQFKDYFGITPTEYRHNYSSNDTHTNR